AIEREQRISGIDEDRVAQRPCAEEVCLLRVGKNAAKVVPGFDEERAKRIAARRVFAGEDADQPVAALQQKREEAAAKRRILSVERDLLEHVDEEGIPGLMREVQRFELGFGERRGGNVCR